MLPCEAATSGWSCELEEAGAVFGDDVRRRRRTEAADVSSKCKRSLSRAISRSLQASDAVVASSFRFRAASLRRSSSCRLRCISSAILFSSAAKSA